jgi:hypothetical protein
LLVCSSGANVQNTTAIGAAAPAAAAAAAAAAVYLPLQSKEFLLLPDMLLLQCWLAAAFPSSSCPLLLAALGGLPLLQAAGDACYVVTLLCYSVNCNWRACCHLLAGLVNKQQLAFGRSVLGVAAAGSISASSSCPMMLAALGGLPLLQVLCYLVILLCCVGCCCLWFNLLQQQLS